MNGAELYRDLGWLAPMPSDWRHGLAALDPGSPDFGRELQALAGHALGLEHLSLIAGAVARGRQAGASLAPLTPFRLGVIGDGNLQPAVCALIGTAVRAGFALEVVSGRQGQALQEALSPDSPVNASRLDAMLVALDWRSLPLSSATNDEDAHAAVEATLAYIRDIRRAVECNSGAVCILSTIAPPAETLVGNLEPANAWTIRNMVSEVNRGIVAEVGKDGLLLDVDGLACTVGLAAWHDPSQWDLRRAPFAEEWLPLYAETALRVIAAARGKSRRVLVLALDKTAWGFVIGQNGRARPARTAPAGEAYLAVQKLALSLHARGVILAVCCRDGNSAAREIFVKRSDLLLQREHITVFRANWMDKAANVRAIAEELGLGLESIVLLDDDPVDREYVRRVLPQIAVVEVGSDPSLYARTLAAGGYFELSTFREAAAHSREPCRPDVRRTAVNPAASAKESYLASLAVPA